jgi:hypothetical protein
MEPATNAHPDILTPKIAGGVRMGLAIEACLMPILTVLTILTCQDDFEKLEN